MPLKSLPVESFCKSKKVMLHLSFLSIPVIFRGCVLYFGEWHELFPCLNDQLFWSSKAKIFFDNVALTQIDSREDILQDCIGNYRFFVGHKKVQYFEYVFSDKYIPKA